MRIRAYIYLSILGLLFFSSCQKNIDIFDADPVLFDSTWLNIAPAGSPVNALREELALPLHNDSIELAGSVADLTFTSGLHCTMATAGLVDSFNNPITGKIKANTLSILKKGDIIRQGKSTKTDTALLDCSSITMIALEKDDHKLLLKQAAVVNIDYSSLAFSETLKIFYEQDGNTWRKNSVPVNNIALSNTGYQLQTNILNWLCVGKFLHDDPQPATTIKISLPKNYTNTNSTAYLILKNRNTAVKLMENVAGKWFYHPFIPIDEAGSIIVISKQVNDYYLGTSNFEALAAGETLLEVKPVKTSFDEIKTFLNTL